MRGGASGNGRWDGRVIVERSIEQVQRGKVENGKLDTELRWPLA